MQTKRLKFLIILSTAFCTMSSAYAVTSWNEFLPQPLLRSDMEKMKEKARVELTEKPLGTELAWENQETGLKGSVFLEKIFTIKSFECRGIRHIVTFQNQEKVQFNGTLCQNSEGKWESMPFIFLDK